MTISVPMKEATNRLCELVRCMESGERVIVTRHGKPVFEMVVPRRGGIDFEALDAWKEQRGYTRMAGRFRKISMIPCPRIS